MEKLLANRIVLIPILLSIAAGAVVSIATGFYLTYQMVTLIGN